jgi:hypothetical protein
VASKTYRTTISIPQDLKVRMDAVADRVNWSAVAARAFEAELVRVEMQRRETMSKEDVIRRMKAAGVEESEQEKAEGVAAGRAWAEREATPGELRRLQRYCDSIGNDWWQIIGRDDTSAYSPGELIYFGFHPGDDKDRDAAEAFWESAIGEGYEGRMTDGDFLDGFVDGALAVWSEVRDKL